MVDLHDFTIIWIELGLTIKNWDLTRGELGLTVYPSNMWILSFKRGDERADMELLNDMWMIFLHLDGGMAM